MVGKPFIKKKKNTRPSSFKEKKVSSLKEKTESAYPFRAYTTPSLTSFVKIVNNLKAVYYFRRKATS